MSEQTAVYNGFFKAKDRFLNAHNEAGFEPDVIYEYIHWGMLMSSLHWQGVRQENSLLCELFLKQVYQDMLDAISNPKHTRIYRRVCLDSVNKPLVALKRYYSQFEHGEEVYLRLKHQLRFVQAPLD